MTQHLFSLLNQEQKAKVGLVRSASCHLLHLIKLQELIIDTRSAASDAIVVICNETEHVQ